MIHAILVPLDGSTLAEQALPAAAAMAQRHAATLNLAVVHPWGPAVDSPRIGNGADEECRAAEGVYLSRLTQAVTSSYRVPVCEAVLEGATGPALAEFARRRQIDLVIMSTHGHGLLRRLVASGTAHHLVHRLQAPVLLFKPWHTAEPSPFKQPSFTGFARILIASHGAAQAEAALAPAMTLAATDGATVTLLDVVSPSLCGGAELERRQEQAQAALTSLMPRLTARGFGVNIATVVGVNPAPALLTYARQHGADLIVLTPRERHAGELAVFGSVADAVIHHGDTPVLICHAAG